MENKKYKTISTRLKMLRIANGYTQENIAIELGISQNAYSNNERNVRTIPLDRLFKIAQILKVNVSQLLDPSFSLELNSIEEST